MPTDYGGRHDSLGLEADEADQVPRPRTDPVTRELVAGAAGLPDYLVVVIPAAVALAIVAAVAAWLKYRDR